MRSNAPGFILIFMLSIVPNRINWLSSSKVLDNVFSLLVFKSVWLLEWSETWLSWGGLVTLWDWLEGRTWRGYNFLHYLLHWVITLRNIIWFVFRYIVFIILFKYFFLENSFPPFFTFLKFVKFIWTSWALVVRF